MKNKIIAGVIAILFIPVMTAVCWVLLHSLLVDIVFALAAIVFATVCIYKSAIILLDEHSEKHKQP